MDICIRCRYHHAQHPTYMFMFLHLSVDAPRIDGLIVKSTVNLDRIAKSKIEI